MRSIYFCGRAIPNCTGLKTGHYKNRAPKAGLKPAATKIKNQTRGRR
jgi:hypothetical protein